MQQECWRVEDSGGTFFIMQEDVYCWRVEDWDDIDDIFYDFKTEAEALDMAKFIRSMYGEWVTTSEWCWQQKPEEKRVLTVRPMTFKSCRKILDHYRKIWENQQKVTL